MEEDTDSEYIKKKDRLPEEVPTKAMEACLSKYVVNPKMEITVQDFVMRSTRNVILIHYAPVLL